MISHEPYDNIIGGIAYEQSRRYPATTNDLKQEILTEFYSESTQNGLADIPDDETIRRQGYVRSMAYRTASKAGLAEKAFQEGFKVRDVAFYSTAQVEQLMDGYFQWKSDGSLPMGEPGAGSSNVPANMRGTAQAEMCDVSRAFDKLTWDQKDLLYLLHGSDALASRWEAVAADHSTNVKALKERHRRIMRVMCNKLNDYRADAVANHDGPGARTVVSNSRAQWLTSRSGS